MEYHAAVKKESHTMEYYAAVKKESRSILIAQGICLGSIVGI